MKALTAASLAAFALAGCASAPPTATVSATGEADKGYMHVLNGKRQETLVGSRLPRESRENAESVKSMSRKGYQEGQTEKSGSPLQGGG